MICLPCHGFLPPFPRPHSRREGGGTLGYFMQGAQPLASPGLNGARHWLDLPLWFPAGGFVSCEAGLRLRSDTRQGVAVRTRHW